MLSSPSTLPPPGGAASVLIPGGKIQLLGSDCNRYHEVGAHNATNQNIETVFFPQGRAKESQTDFRVEMVPTLRFDMKLRARYTRGDGNVQQVTTCAERY